MGESLTTVLALSLSKQHYWLMLLTLSASVQYISVHFTAAALIYVWLPELKKVHSVCDVLYQHWSYILTHHYYSIIPQRHLSVPLSLLEMSATWLAHGIKSTHRKIMSLWQQWLAYVSPQWHAQSQTLHYWQSCPLHDLGFQRERRHNVKR